MTQAAPKFDHKVLLKNLEDTKNSLPNLDPEPFYKTMLEYVKIFDAMGSALQMAFKDISGKVWRIGVNYGLHPEVKGGIMDFIKWEESEKVAILNGENPEKVPDQKYLGYESTARTVLRLMWFLDFVSSLVGQMETNRKTSVATACKKAYDQALAPHHDWKIRLAAKTAMTFAPGRKTLLAALFPEGTPEEEQYAEIRKMMELVEPTRKYLWDYFKEHDLTKLP